MKIFTHYSVYFNKNVVYLFLKMFYCSNLKSGIYGLKKVPKNRILFLLFNSLLPLLLGIRLFLRRFLGSFLRPYITDLK